MVHKLLMLVLILCALCCRPAFATWSNYASCHVRTDGLDTNGGWFDSSIASAGTDYTDQAAAALAVTDVVTHNTTSISSVTGGFTAAMIGDAIYLTGSGTTTGRYFLTAVADTNDATVDRATGSTGGTGVTGNLGGALLTPLAAANNGSGQGTSEAQSGNLIYVRANGGTVASPDYALSGSWVPCTSGNDINVVGYNGMPVLKYAGPCLQPKGSILARNLWCVGNGSGQPGIYSGSASSSAAWTFVDCKCDSSGEGMIVDTSLGSVTAFDCSFSSCTTFGIEFRGGATYFDLYDCSFVSDGSACFKETGASLYPSCFTGCYFIQSGDSTGDVYISADYTKQRFVGCRFVGKSSGGCDGLYEAGRGDMWVLRDNVFTGYTTAGKYAVNFTTASRADGDCDSDYNVFYGNNVTYLNHIVLGANDKTTSPKDADAGMSNYAPLDSTSASWANGWPTSFLGLATTPNYPDRGPAQAIPPTASGGGLIINVGTNGGSQ